MVESSQNQDTKHTQHSMHSEQHQHGDHKHHHAFSDPAALAKKWNDPKRDLWQRPEEIVAALDVTPGATIADIGAGTGYMVAHLSKAVGPKGTIIAIDTSAAMIDYLAAHRDELSPAKIEPRQVSPDNPEFQTASLDGVLTLDSWHHIEGREAYAKKVYDGLKPGGKFLVVDHEPTAEVGPPKSMRLDASELSKQLEAAGFRVYIASESMPHHYMVVGQK